MEAIRYITEIDEGGHLKKVPTIEELKGQEVEVIIKSHPRINKSKVKSRHQKLRDKIKSKGKPLSQYVTEERESNR